MERPATQNVGANILGVLGLVLYAVVGYIYLVSGLVVPAPWLFLLWAIWLAGLWPLIVVFRRRRVLTPLVAVAAFAVWWIYVSLGGAFLDWRP